MRSKRVAVICLVLILFTSLLAPVSADESHDNFDEAETDLSGLLIALNRTQSLMNMSLDDSRSVDYDQWRSNGSDLNQSRLDFEFDQEALNSSLELSEDSTQSIEAAKYILDEIEGDVSSYEYIKEMYTPYYRLSDNLSSFTGDHSSLISDLTRVIQKYNGVAAGNGTMDHLINGMEILHGARLTLRGMNSSLNRMQEEIEEINRTYLDPKPLEESIEETYPLLTEYEGQISELIGWLNELYEDNDSNATSPSTLSDYLSLNRPDKVHPGETFSVYGFYLKENNYTRDTEIDLSVDGNHTETSSTDEDGYYEIEYTVPWNRSLGEMKLQTEVKDGNISSTNKTVEVVKYNSSVRIKTDRRAYYRENITIDGTFSTDAPVDLRDIMLNWSDETQNLSQDGSFTRVLSHQNFSWGTHSIGISYDGNRTIKSADDTTIFEISIPTSISLSANTSRVFSEGELITMNGTLLNRSSQEGISGQNVSLQMDGDEYLINRTRNASNESAGYYRFSLNSTNLSDRLHRFHTRYDGTFKYRSCESDPLYLYKEGEYILLDEDPEELEERMEDIVGDSGGEGEDTDQDDGDGWPPWDDPLEGGLDGDVYDLIERYWFFVILIVFTGVFVTIYVLSRREKEEKTKEMEGVAKEKKTPSTLAKKEADIFQAEGETEVPQVYNRFTEKLDEQKVIELTSGMTHRDISRLLVDKMDLEEDIDTVTRVFEKAYFSGRSVMESEIDRFNSALKNIWRGVSS